MIENREKKIKDFLDLIKNQFTGKTTVSEIEKTPFYMVGLEFGFTKELLDFYFQSLDLGSNSIELIEKFNDQNEEEKEKAISGEIFITEKEAETIRKVSGRIKDSSVFDLSIDDDISIKSKYIFAYWNREYSKFIENNQAIHKLLTAYFEVKEKSNIPFFKVYDLFKSHKKELEKLLVTPNGVGRIKFLELRDLVSSVIQAAHYTDDLVTSLGLNSKVIDFLFKINQLNDSNVEFLKGYYQNNSSENYPIFWLFNQYLISLSKTENNFLIYQIILSKQDYSDQHVAELRGLDKNRIQQIRQDFLEKIQSIISDFKTTLSNQVVIDFFVSSMDSFVDYNEAIMSCQKEQLTSFRLSFCNVLLSKFNEEFVVTGEYNEMFRAKNVFGKKCKALHLLDKKYASIYFSIIDDLVKLSEKGEVRKLYNYPLKQIKAIDNQYLRDTLNFELLNWSFKIGHTFIDTPIAIDFDNGQITRVDVQHRGISEFKELEDYLLIKNNFDTFYNNDLKHTFCEGNTYGYTSIYNSTMNRHVEDLGYHSIAGKWIKKSYILQFVEESIFDYNRCNFRDLIIELIKKNPDKYNGKNTSFWLQELNSILQHNYPGTNNISAILRDDRVTVNRGNIFLLNK